MHDRTEALQNCIAGSEYHRNEEEKGRRQSRVLQVAGRIRQKQQLRLAAGLGG